MSNDGFSPEWDYPQCPECGSAEQPIGQAVLTRRWRCWRCEIWWDVQTGETGDGFNFRPCLN